ncbi:MAG: hypothetical protein RL005_515 [Planctomycetota bacterium]|jgi:hypothetical protein
MTLTRGTVLVCGPRPVVAPLQAVLEALGGRVVTSPTPDGLTSRFEQERPDAVVLPAHGLGSALERALARERHACAVVGLASDTPPTHPELFDLLVHGTPDAAWAEPLRLVLLLGRARREAQDAGREVMRLRESTSAQVLRITGLLLNMLDRRHPGSTERSAQLAELSLQVAERFSIPDDMLPGLNLAARLRGVGRLALPGDKPGTPGDPAWEWSVTQATASLLEPFPELAQAVELLQAMHENWDGTGSPSHLLSGQIPMRSRILRAVHDYLVGRNAPGAPAASEILERMSDLTNTLYDPLVIVHLRAIVETSGSPSLNALRLYLPVPELSVGMMLAEDLYTDSGIKLLSRGTTLSHAALDVIQRRHAQEPMYRGVAIQRKPAGD